MIDSFRRHAIDLFADNGFVTAWMFVPQDLADAVTSGAVTYVERRNACGEDGFSAAYAWMRAAMSRSGLSEPSSTQKSDLTPWWCWIQASNGRNIPTLDDAEAGAVLFELKIPMDELLVSRFTAWHCVLNYWYLSKSEQDDENFEAQCMAAGLSSRDREALAKTRLHDVIEQSWDSIFDLTNQGNYWFNDLNEEMLQGVFWELRPEMVVGRVDPAPSVD
jgi:hypothetical protein